MVFTHLKIVYTPLADDASSSTSAPGDTSSGNDVIKVSVAGKQISGNAPLEVVTSDYPTLVVKVTGAANGTKVARAINEPKERGGKKDAVAANDGDVAAKGAKKTSTMQLTHVLVCGPVTVLVDPAAVDAARMLTVRADDGARVEALALAVPEANCRATRQSHIDVTFRVCPSRWHLPDGTWHVETTMLVTVANDATSTVDVRPSKPAEGGLEVRAVDILSLHSPVTTTTTRTSRDERFSKMQGGGNEGEDGDDAGGMASLCGEASSESKRSLSGQTSGWANVEMDVDQ